MSDAPFVVARLSGNHDRASFTCGIEPLDRYFRQQASQDIRRRVANCFVMTELATGVVARYYTLAATNIQLYELPVAVIARLPRYPTVPAALLGRLAIATAFQGRKLGAAMLTDAITRTALAEIATFAVVVDPKDDTARRFHDRHGFADLPPPERRMFMTIETALRFIRSGEK